MVNKMIKIIKAFFSKNPSLDISVKHGNDNSFVLNTFHKNNKVEFSSHHPVSSILPLPIEGDITLHDKDLVHSHHLRIERDNGDVLKIFQCPNDSFTVIELVKKPYFSLIIAKSKNDLIVDGVDYSADASNILLKRYRSLFKKYKKLLGVSKQFKSPLNRDYSFNI